MNKQKKTKKKTAIDINRRNKRDKRQPKDARLTSQVPNAPSPLHLYTNIPPPTSDSKPTQTHANRTPPHRTPAQGHQRQGHKVQGIRRVLVGRLEAGCSGYAHLLGSKWGGGEAQLCQPPGGGESSACKCSPWAAPGRLGRAPVVGRGAG